jgi:N-acetylglucosamine kinase-like BadF-type ATPase
VDAACLGLAGAGRPDDQAQIREWTARIDLARRVDITTDVALLLAAGTPEGWGLAVVAGTGSMAYGRSADGRTARAGGWGYLLGDEGSGYALAVAGLQAIARAADERGPATRLTEHFLQHLGLRQASELVAVIYRGGWDRTRLAALAGLVMETAGEKDEVAERLVELAAQALALTAATSVRKLGFSGEVPFALAGGLLVSSASYRELFLATLSRLGVRAEPVTLVAEPAEGAVRLALASVAPPAGGSATA